MIEAFEIWNFKSWRKTGTVKLAPVTALFGTNSSGKSSLLQFFLLLKQTKDTTDRSLALDFGGEGKFVNLGSYHECLHDHDLLDYLAWNVVWKLDGRLKIADPASGKNDILFEDDSIQLGAMVNSKTKAGQTARIRYHFGGYNFDLRKKKAETPAYKLSVENKSGDKGFRFVRNKGRAWDLPGPVKSYAFPDQVRTYHQNADFLSEFELAYESLMDRIFYLGPLRDFPRREYIWSGARPLDVGMRGERVVDAVLAATAAGEQRNRGRKQKLRPFQVFIAEWLKDLGLIHAFAIREIGRNSNLYRVEVQRTSASAPVLITDVGFGVSQFLPVLALLYYVPENSVVLLEQPEIHLHPSVQSGLADIIINAAQTRNIQVIVESHSEHFLRRLQRRIAEEKISKDYAKIYFCRSVGKTSKIGEIQVNEYGRIENWPKNFFGDEFGEISAIAEAEINKKAAAE